MEQNNLFMVYMKSEQHCYCKQMFQGTEKDGRLKESHLNEKLKTFFFSVLDDVLQTTKQTFSMLIKPIFSPYTSSTQVFLMEELIKGEVKR